MTRRFCKFMKMIGYILTPEFSPPYDRQTSVPANRIRPANRLLQHVKTAVWILISIVLSIVLGQVK